MKQIGFWAMASKSKASGLNFKVQTTCKDAEPACGLQFAGIIPQHGLTRMSFEASGVFAANFRQCFTYVGCIFLPCRGRGKSKAKRISFRFAVTPFGAGLQGFDCAGFIKMYDGVELFANARVEIMAPALGVGPIDDANGPFEARMAQSFRSVNSIAGR